jgi:hypothetical protein
VVCALTSGGSGEASAQLPAFWGGCLAWGSPPIAKKVRAWLAVDLLLVCCWMIGSGAILLCSTVGPQLCLKMHAFISQQLDLLLLVCCYRWQTASRLQILQLQAAAAAATEGQSTRQGATARCAATAALRQKQPPYKLYRHGLYVFVASDESIDYMTSCSGCRLRHLEALHATPATYRIQ